MVLKINQGHKVVLVISSDKGYYKGVHDLTVWSI